MNRIAALVCPVLLLATLPASAAVSDPALEAAARAADAQVLAWRRDIHQHPELGNREFRTAQKVAGHLQSLGLEVKTGVAHTGVVGILRGGRPGPAIALRADMDALPVTEQVDLPFKSVATAEYRGETVGVMHACGHDAHTAILMGAAQVLAGLRKDLPGTVLFVFQPAEEGGPVMAASDSYRIAVRGRQSHGARPWEGVDPIVVASQVVLGMQTIVSRQTDITRYPAVLSVGAIKGGIRSNIIPDEVELVGTLRTFDRGNGLGDDR